MNRLVLASLNQGARLVGVLERRCRNHLMQRTDVRAGAIWQDADFPDGPYGPHDYADSDALTEFEAENEVHEPRSDVDKCSYCPVNDGIDCAQDCAQAKVAWDQKTPQEMPDELWDRPRCGAPTGRCSNRCLLPPGHDGEHDDDPPEFHSLDCCCPKCLEQLGPKHWTAKLQHKYCGAVHHNIAGTFVCNLSHDHRGSHGSGVVSWPDLATHSSAPGTSPEAPVVAGASPGGATHPAPPGERETSMHRQIAVVASDHCYDIRRLHQLAAEGSHCRECQRIYPCPTVQILDRPAAALYPMQPQEKP